MAKEKQNKISARFISTLGLLEQFKGTTVNYSQGIVTDHSCATPWHGLAGPPFSGRLALNNSLSSLISCPPITLSCLCAFMRASPRPLSHFFACRTPTRPLMPPSKFPSENPFLVYDPPGRTATPVLCAPTAVASSLSFYSTSLSDCNVITYVFKFRALLCYSYIFRYIMKAKNMDADARLPSVLESPALLLQLCTSQ